MPIIRLKIAVSRYFERIPEPDGLGGLTATIGLRRDEGWVVVHNHVKPAHPLGAYGFRAWLSKREPNIEPCPCKWAPKLGGHYHVKGAGYSKAKRLPSRSRIWRDEDWR